MADNMMEWSIRDAKEQVGPGSVMMDGWELKELLGQGGFGDVWLAEKKLLGNWIVCQQALIDSHITAKTNEAND